MFAGARWRLGPARLVLLLASLSTLPLLAPPAVAQSLPGTPDPTLLPVATTLQVPLTAAYNALNVPAIAAGTWYLDPTTQVRIYKLTSATYPAASANWGHDYAEGGDEVSLPYSGNTRAVLVRQNGGSWWLVDFTPGVGVSNPRPLTGNLAPFMDLTFTFSNNPATPYYAYVSRGSTIYRFDIRTMTEAPGNGWPVTGESSAMWLHQSENDGFFVWMRGANGSTIVGYEPATGTKKTYTNANLNEPRIDRAGRYVGISMAGNGLTVWDWNTSSVTWSTPGDPGIPFAHNASLRRRWLTVDWNMSYPPDYGMFISDVPNSGQHIAGPANGTLVHGSGNWIQQPADLDDQWAVFTHYGSLRPPEAFWLAPGGMVLITPNGQRRLLGHPYNTTSNYTFFSFAKFAPDGKYVLFTSNMNGSGRSDLFLAELPQTSSDVLPPTASITAPANGATVSGAVIVSASASDDVGVIGVQFKLDGATLGAEDTLAPYSISWNTTLATNGSHTLTAVARDAAGNPGTSSAVTVTVSNPDTTPPTVSLASPLAGATVSSIVTIVATASDNVGVAGVQFKLDGTNLGPELVLSPYLFAWPTTTVPNGPHTLTAVARDAAGNTTTSSGVTVTVSNLPPADGTPPLISAVVASALTASDATITWTTDEASDSQVEYGPTTAYGSVAPLNTTLVTAHSQTLSGLAAGTVYHYRVKSRDAAGNLATSGDFSFTTLAPPPGPGTDLVGYWKFDEGSGTSAADASGNGHTGSLINGPTWTAGKIGQALSFDATNDYVQISHATPLNAYPLTVAVWIKTSTTAGVRGIVNKYVAGSYNGYQLFMNAGNLCAWYLRDNTNYVYDGSGCTLSTAGVNDNQWHHVVFVVDAAGGRLYVDGIPKASQAWTGTAGPPSTLQPVHLADYPGVFGGAEYLPGVLDEVRIYNRALSAGEVGALYTAGTPTPQGVIWTNLVNVTATGNSLQKTGGCDGCPDAGATSQQQIAAGDGYLEFTASETLALRFAGLSNASAGTAPAEIKFAIRLQSGIADVRESGVYRTDTSFATGDVLRIAVESGLVRYYKNGTLFYTSAIAPTYPLGVDTSLLNLNGTITNAVIFGGSAGVAADTTPPTVSLSAPLPGATVGGSLTVSASASDNVGVLGVQFKLDGTNLGVEATAAPYAISWDTRTVPDGAHTLTAVARDAAGNVAVSSAVTITVSNPDTTPPTVSIGSPLPGATVSGTSTVTGTAADNVALSRVEVVVDGGAPQPASGTTAWTLTLNTLALSNGTHTIVARAVDTAGNTGTASVSVTVSNDTTAPTISLTSPLSGATVSGTTTVAANALDNVGVVGVQFKLDGANLVAEAMVAPYAISWNTATATNGAHTLTAFARDAAGNVTTSAPVTVTVNNDATPPVLSAVTASGITASGATITWTTDEASDSQVEYGPTTAYGSVTPLNTTLVAAHSQTLSGLAASTLYHYRVKSRDAAGNLAVSGDFTFTTPGNLLLNGGFEGGQVGWTNWSSNSRFVTTLSPYAGSFALQINAGSSNRYVGQTIPATAGRTYTISMALRTSLTTSKGRGRIQWLNSSGGVIGSLYFGDTTGSTPWTVKTTTRTAPSGATQLRVSCYVTSGGSGSAWFDAVEVR